MCPLFCSSGDESLTILSPTFRYFDGILPLVLFSIKELRRLSRSVLMPLVRPPFCTSSSLVRSSPPSLQSVSWLALCPPGNLQHSIPRFQRRDRRVQEHLIHRVGCRWPGQDPPSLEALCVFLCPPMMGPLTFHLTSTAFSRFPKHSGHHLRCRLK